MVNASEKLGLLNRLVVSIQGLCSVYAGHYAEGVPYSVQKEYTFRDLIRKDNILQQQEKFVLRGNLEVKALQKARHVIGRTDWDRACAEQINPKSKYHFCNETLREAFYQGAWSYDGCTKHRIFASSCAYPVKGFHYLLEALAEVRKFYPDAVIAVPGSSFLSLDARGKLRQSSYQKYMAELVRKYQLEDHIEFLGHLGPEQMKEQFLRANVFVLPSTIENSPNSLGEAMLLGVPCVATLSGGVATMLEHNKEGFVYQSTAPYMLAHYIKRVFSMEAEAREIGQAASVHGGKTHDPQQNLNRLMEIYAELAAT
jgi:glycosyltransferase involved in cell wall biosynthesis